ncbi:hypothetical protein FOA52_002047, partial [Chlamydomonas sp. UWO 241]
MRRETSIAAKYAFVWLRKVFPNGTDHHRAMEEKGSGCPVRRIYLQDDAGRTEVLHPDDLSRLEAGARVFDGYPARFETLHPGFPSGSWYVQGNEKYWSNSLEEFMTISFAKPTRVYVLLPSLSQEPKWLREQFHKLRDPNFQEIKLKVSWKMSWGAKLVNLVIGQLQHARREVLRVFRAKDVMLPGEEMRLGGLGLAHLMDSPFLVAFKAENMSNAQMIQHSIGRSTMGVNAGGSTFSLTGAMSYESWHAQLVKSVRRNRVVDVRLMIETDRLRPASQSHMARHDISVLPDDGKERLLV